MQQFEQRVCGIDLNREWSNETLIDMLLRLWKLKTYRRILTCCKIAYTPVAEILFQRKSSPQSQKQVFVEEEITDSPKAEKLLCLLAGFGRHPIFMEPGKSCSQKGVSSEKLSTTLSKSIARRDCWSWRLPSTVNRESHSLRSFVYCRRGEDPADDAVGCWAIKRQKNFLLLHLSRTD